MQMYAVFCLILFIIPNSSQQNNTSGFFILPLTIEGFPDSNKKTEKSPEQLIYSLTNLKHKVSTFFTGTPKESFPFELSFDTFSLYISSNNVSNNQTNIKKYNPSSSSTYKEYSKEEDKFIYQKCSKCVIAQEKFYISENENIKEFPDIYFVMGNKLRDDSNNVSASIGLKPIKSPNDTVDDNLITQLRQKKYLQEYTFRIRYSSKKNGDGFSNGELIIGSYPHQYIPMIYDEKNFKYFYRDSLEEWSFTPTEINYGIKNLIIPITSYNVTINLNSIFITGSLTFLKLLKISFFDKLENNGQCQTFSNENNLLFYICDEGINITEMSDLVFYAKISLDKINMTFTPNDLFYKYIDKEGKNKLLYLVCFDKNSYSTWKLGTIFIKKFQPVFNFDKKTIGFYDTIFYDEEDKYEKYPSKKEEIKSVNTVLIIIIITVSVLLIGLAVFFYFYVKKNKFRTKRANELTDDDNYLYEPDNVINDENDKKDKLVNN